MMLVGGWFTKLGLRETGEKLSCSPRVSSLCHLDCPGTLSRQGWHQTQISACLCPHVLGLNAHTTPVRWDGSILKYYLVLKWDYLGDFMGQPALREAGSEAADVLWRICSREKFSLFIDSLGPHFSVNSLILQVKKWCWAKEGESVTVSLEFRS